MTLINKLTNMIRRRATTVRLRKANRIRPGHVRGKGDVPYKAFNCLNPECQEWLVVREDEIGVPFEIVCPACDYTHRSGEEQVFYDYALVKTGTAAPLEEGSFGILVDDYIDEAARYKYCVICSTLKPLEYFDTHSSRRTGRQSECRLCKRVYNSIKNRTRTTDQHREAAQKRRLYLDLSGSAKIDSRAVYSRFQYKCFKCATDLRNVRSEADRPLDHTLPAYYLWPLTTGNATLLCRAHNAEKSGKWPSLYYGRAELKRLAAQTGYAFELLAGPPTYNPEALRRLAEGDYVDALLMKYAPYMPELIKLRNRILKDTQQDLFAVSRQLSRDWIDQANAVLD